MPKKRYSPGALKALEHMAWPPERTQRKPGKRWIQHQMHSIAQILEKECVGVVSEWHSCPLCLPEGRAAPTPEPLAPELQESVGRYLQECRALHDELLVKWARMNQSHVTRGSTETTDGFIPHVEGMASDIKIGIQQVCRCESCLTMRKVIDKVWVMMNPDTHKGESMQVFMQRLAMAQTEQGGGLVLATPDQIKDHG